MNRIIKTDNVWKTAAHLHIKWMDLYFKRSLSTLLLQ